MSHRIRLGPPWDVTSADGRTRHARKFGRPRTLAPNERIWLVFEALPTGTDVSLNGEPIGTAEAGPTLTVDITPLLQPRNEVVLRLPGECQLGEVALEIRS
jgi:hypothetical protein